MAHGLCDNSMPFALILMWFRCPSCQICIWTVLVLPECPWKSAIKFLYSDGLLHQGGPSDKHIWIGHWGVSEAGGGSGFRLGMGGRLEIVL